MATTFEAIYLGVLPILDPQEGNDNLSTTAVDQWLGSYGSATDKLGTHDSIVEISPGSTGFGGGYTGSYDLDNYYGYDTFSVNGGADQYFDAAMNFNAVITYGDGTTAQISAIIMQDTDGNAYWVAESSENADHFKIEDAANHGGIQSLDLISPIYSDPYFPEGYRLWGDRADTNFVPCFVAGALIETERGMVPVEEIVAGDMVRTMDHGMQPVRWVGSREVPAQGHLAPIVFTEGAIGNAREFAVSPQHRMLLSDPAGEMYFDSAEVLISAKDMLNSDRIYRRPGGEVRYVHLLFDRHQIVFVEGVPSESFHPGEFSLGAVDEAMREEVYAIFPELRDNPAAYSRTVRTRLKRHEAAVLLDRVAESEATKAAS